jgi:biotin carboxyl carrier protein
MYSITINGTQTLKTNLNTSNKEFEGTLNDAIVKGNFEKINPYQYHFLMNNRSYNVDVVKVNSEEKTLVVKINSVKFNLQLKDKYDELLHSLGLDNLATKKVNDVKAPMPGMVLNVLVKEGDDVKKGDALIILEAMKMENILKSPSDGHIKKIAINKGLAVEKNQILIQFS